MKTAIFFTTIATFNNITNVVTTLLQHCVVSQPFTNIVTINVLCLLGYCLEIRYSLELLTD